MGQTQGHELPYDIGERFSCLSSKTIWSVHAGKKKVNGEPVTVFVFDFTNRSQEEIKLAQSAHLRLKTLRHPNILKYIDGVELPTCIYVVTEESVPLEDYMGTSDGSSNFSISWGLHQILKSLCFLTNDCKLTHRNICLSSVFVDDAGEWKLAGVEFMCPQGELASAPLKTLEQLMKYDPPESSKPVSARRTEKWSTDIWGCGCLVWEVFNGPLHQVSSLRNTSKIPKLLIPHYCEMVGANPKSRPNPSVLLDSLRAHEGYLANKFVSIALRIEEVQIMEPTQRNDFFNELNKSLDSFPESFAKHKILPQLINAFEFGGAGSSVLAPLFKLGALLKGDQYQKMIVPCVVKLFSSTDRATRLNLLQQLEHLVDHLLPVTVNDQIFPNIANGFSDTVPAMREQTVKATVLLAPKLSSSTLNGALLKHLARCQLDEQPSIRTNTNICLGRIAGYLSPATRQKVLVTAFLRGLKDPYPQARIAAIGSMGATHTLLCTSDISSRILPTLCTITVDKEKSVRDQAFKTIKFFLGKLEKISEDPLAAAEQEKIEASSTSWTGWAMSSIASTFSKTPQSQATPTSSTGGGVKGTAEEREREGAANAKDTTVRGGDVTGGSGNQGSQKNEPSRKESNFDDDWNDEDGWEDVGGQGRNRSEQGRGGGGGGGGEGEVVSKEDSDMEGWEDDGWGAFDAPPPLPPSSDTNAGTTAAHSTREAISGGADFFDNIPTQSQRTKPPPSDPFESFGLSGTEHGRGSTRDRTPPVLTSASLFGGGGSGDTKAKSGGGGDGWGERGGGGGWGEGGGGDGWVEGGAGGDGWGDWNEDFEVKSSTKPAQQTALISNAGTTIKQGIRSKESLSASKSEQEGHVSPTSWDSNWGTFDKPKSAGDSMASPSRQEVLQNKREERRLKQQAAREKRAAGVKPGGLGAVKKD